MFPYTLVAVDPGMTIGGAWYDPDTFDGQCFDVFEETDPTEIYQHIKVLALRPKPVCLIVEDFVGSGHLTKEAKQTVKVLGMVEYGFCTTKNIRRVETRNPQKRRAYVQTAKEMMQTNGLSIRKGAGADSLSALAHCLSFYYDYAKKPVPAPR